MYKFTRAIVFGYGIACCAAAAFADGADKMYDYREGYIDELEIIGDIVFPGEGSFAMFEMAHMQMRFYVPPDAAYVQIDPGNPIIAQQWRFEGAWVSTATSENERWADCPGGPVFDHEDQQRRVYGDLVWSYVGLEDGDLYFNLQIGHCDGPVEDWAYNDPSRNPPTLAEATEICGNDRDLVLRANGCSDIIANPNANVQDISWAYWSRAYVRCSEAPVSDTIADLMTAVRLDPLEWQQYYQRVSQYRGPLDGQMNYQLHRAVERFANRKCR